MSALEREAIWVAALLHDIGKFRQRAGVGDSSKRHQAHSAEFIESDFAGYFVPLGSDCAHAVANHHGRLARDAEKLVALSDRLSASEREEAEREGEAPVDAPLVAVCSRLEGSPAELRLSLTSLSDEQDAVLPSAQATAGADAYARLWSAFTQDMRRFTGSAGYQPGDYVTIASLLGVHTSRVPSATPWQSRGERTIPDVSLYDHMRTSAAIAACLEQELGPDDLDLALSRDASTHGRQVCLLVKGDLSGVQDFLYLLSARGAARGLRGRSFYLQLLGEAVALWILRELGLPSLNFLFAGGGHFYLLVPCSVADKLAEVRRQLAAKLLAIHGGDLGIAIAATPVTLADLWKSRVGTLLGGLGLMAAREKRRRWSDLGDQIGAYFEAREVGGLEGLCDVCRAEGAFPADAQGNRKCGRCAGFEELGRLLRDPSHLLAFVVGDEDPAGQPDWRAALRAFGLDVHVMRANDPVPRPPNGTAEAIVWSFAPGEVASEHTLQRFRWDHVHTSYCYRWLADATPRLPGGTGIAEFSDLAEASRGVSWLGVLRMDVDDLGEVFSRGLQGGGEEKRASLSRVASLSESIRLFFEAYVPRLCREWNEGASGAASPQLYLIYAGGDDLFLVGSWSALPEMALKIRDAFRVFVGGDHVTLSAGIGIAHDKFPLYMLAEAAREALDSQAKTYGRTAGGAPAKNALSFLGQAIPWQQMSEVARWQQRLADMLRPSAGSSVRPLPKGFLTRLASIYQLYAQNAARQRHLAARGGSVADVSDLVTYARWQWQSVYQMARVGRSSRDHQEALGELMETVTHRGLIEHLGILARWTALLTREG